MGIGTICNREVVIVRASESLHAAAALMHTHGVGSIVVCEERQDSKPVPVGMLTDRDVVMALLQRGKPLGGLSIGQAMTRDPLLLNEDDEVDAAMERLRARGVRRAPVIGSDGALIGIVSLDDLLELIAEELDTVARLIRRQSRAHRPASPSGGLP